MKRHSTDFEARKILGNLIDYIKLSMNVMFASMQATTYLPNTNNIKPSKIPIKYIPFFLILCSLKMRAPNKKTISTLERRTSAMIEIRESGNDTL